MVATLARVISAWSGLLWYNTHCTQKPPHTCVQVTLARETGPECGAACVVETKEKARRVSVWPPATLRTSRPGAHSAFGCFHYSSFLSD